MFLSNILLRDLFFHYFFISLSFFNEIKRVFFVSILFIFLRYNLFYCLAFNVFKYLIRFYLFLSFWRVFKETPYFFESSRAYLKTNNYRKKDKKLKKQTIKIFFYFFNRFGVGEIRSFQDNCVRVFEFLSGRQNIEKDVSSEFVLARN